MNVIDQLHEHARSRPSDTALIFPQGKITWKQLDQLIWSMACYFHAQGLRERDRVGITVQDQIVHLVVFLSLARIGVAHVSLSFTDPPTVRRKTITALNLKLVVADSKKFSIPVVPTIVLTKMGAFPVDAGHAGQLQSRDDWGALFFLQSSGTTGQPKYAELGHALANERLQRFGTLFDCGARDVFWAASRVDFVVAKQRVLYALQTGAAVCMPLGMTISPELIGFLKRSGVTLACGTPSHLHQLIAASDGANPMPTLRAFEVRSATVSERLRSEFKEKVSPNLYVAYGTNEGDALTLASPELQAKVPNTVGMPTVGIEVAVVDDEDEVLAAGTTGNVRVRGPGVIRHYFENPEATAKSFRDGWFYPGDLGYLAPDGQLVLQGRKDDMMIFDGMNIYPADIENVLFEHPAVKEAAAFAVRHERFQDVPVAAVTLAAEVNEEELMRWCIDRLGIRHPKKIRILAEFPRNAMGKILKRELAAIK